MVPETLVDLAGLLESASPAETTQALYERHATRVSRWAVLLGGPSISAEDVVQEVFVVVHRKLRSLRDAAGAVPWLFRITANVVRHHRRPSLTRLLLGGSAGEVAGKLAGQEPTPSELLEGREASALIYRVLDRMKERYRSLLILYEMEELSTDEIAVLTGMRPVTVRVNLHRARQEFARRYRVLAAREEGAAG